MGGWTDCERAQTSFSITRFPNYCPLENMNMRISLTITQRTSLSSDRYGAGLLCGAELHSTASQLTTLVCECLLV